MFEHILGQAAVSQLRADQEAGTLAPSMLFSGPPASGKGTSGLELARILSCEDPRAPGDCPCYACSRHRLLIHPDLLILGPRPFFAEISAAGACCCREPDSAGRLLFIRSVRKLLARFSPVFWEEDPRFKKVSESLFVLEEALDEFPALQSEELKKSVDKILKNAVKLESEGMSELIPIGHIRRAAAWSHLAPTGKRKMLLIENADRMQEGARNALLKILEEPPPSVSMVLISSREKALLPTIISRLRPYRFIRRSPEVEAAVIHQVFKDTLPEAASVESKGAAGIHTYLSSFLPVSEDSLRPLAAFFAAFIARRTIILLKSKGVSPFPDELVGLGKYATALTEASALGKPGTDTQSVIATVLAETEKFEIRGLFAQFLQMLLQVVMESRVSFGQTQNPALIGGMDIWRKCTAEAVQAVGTYNQNPVLALERLSTEVRRGLAERWS
ncbi:MAG: DNA polymerase III [Treponema sp.]|jgi:DNA polymerase-3 subunit gamma/tau|nr:DNA polymerase III [Treponema sp.]